MPGLTAAAVVASLALVPVATAPTAAAAPAPARPAAGELPERRTASSATRRNADGSLTTTLYAAPVHYRTAAGGWERIDRRLVDAGPGAGPDADGYRWRTAAHAFDARFADRAGADFVQLTVDGARFRLSASGAGGEPGQVDGAAVRYPAAFGRATLTYAVAATGLKSLITLTGPDDPTSYTFRLAGPPTGPAPTVRRRPDGSQAVFLAPRTDPVFVLDAPSAAEARDGTQASPADPAAKPRLDAEQEGRDLVLRLSIDADWLRAPGRRFPVELDPTFTLQPDAEDTYFGMPNYLVNTADNMFAGTTNIAWRAAIRFDLAGLPAGSPISDAKLGLYNASCLGVSGVPYCGGVPHTIDAHRLTAAWSLASSATQFTFDAAAAGSTTMAAGASPAWMSWPITSTVQGWLNGTIPNYGVLLKRRTEELNQSGPMFWGRRYTGNGDLLPKLDVTVVNDAVDLAPPTTVHGNGADLSWTRWAGAAAFQRYEVHRSAARIFTPSEDTLLTTISDPAVTTYRDTTASGGKEFTYRVVANGDASPPRTVTLPPDGQARTLIQPDAAAGQNTYLYYYTGYANCANYGAVDTAYTGTMADGIRRTLVRFDLRSIPPKAPIVSARASLWEKWGPDNPITVEAHRITRAWKEGTGNTTCGADGATWYETQSGQNWSAQGGDFDGAVADSVTVASGYSPEYHTFDIAALVQSWTDGATPNHGLLFKATDETLRNNYRVGFATDDDTVSPTFRPKLEVTYQDGSVTQKPRVELASPAAGGRVSGSAVKLAASAGDDRRVESVDFSVGGAPAGRDTTAPFEITWDSTAVPNGTRSVTLTATDDAGNVTTSPAVDVVVDNTQPPSGSITAPAAGATVTNPVTLTASATDDVGVSSVEFLVDGVRVGAPVTTSPYTVQWNTLDPLARIFDGPHTVTAAITDTSGQQVVTAARSVTVSNAGTSRYRATVELNGAAPEDDVPPVVTENPAAPSQDPYADATPRPDGTMPGSRNRTFTDAPLNDAGTPPASCPVDAYCPTVTVTNTSGSTWSGTGPEVWYTWYAPNGALLYQGVAATTVEADLRNNRSAAPVPLVIRPPKLPPGAERGEFRLRVDLYDRAAGAWFAARGNPPEDNPVIVAKELRGSLGLERFWPYEGEPAGAGMTTLTNVATGNLLLRWSPFFAAGRGLSTAVDLTYNSLEDHSSSPAGNNVSLSLSGLARLGEPIDIHPNNADTISGQSRRFVDVTDGDGTVHRFEGSLGTDGVVRWQEPPGVNLYLRAVSGDPRGAWALTRPDKVTFWFDAEGFPLSVEDRNGNRLTFTLQTTPAGEDPGGPKKRVTAVTDAGGRAFTIDYWSKDEAKKAHVRGNIQRITDHDGSALDFEYYDDGNLRKLIQRGGTQANGEFLADRAFVFTYTTSNGALPAISDPALRADPDPKVGNQSTRLYSVRDPRQRETRFAYYLASDGAQLRWKLKERTNRAGKKTTFGYNLTSRVTTVTAPPDRTTAYTYDTDGKVSRIVDPLNQPTDVEWSPDFKVTKVTEPSTKSSTYTYNANGYLTSQTNTALERTELSYVDSAVDAADTGQHLSLLATVTRPRGTATPTVAGDYQWSFSYDSAGNADKVTDPTTAVTDYDYNLAGSANPGTVAAVRDANGNPATTFPSYDPSGQPTEIRDPLGRSTRFGYDADGLLRWLQDPVHAADTGTDVRAYRSYFDYDSFHRLGRQSAPKSTAFDRGRLIWSGAEFDANDNAVKNIDPHYGSTRDDAENAPYSTSTYDEMDRPDVVSNSDRHEDAAGERTDTDYDDAGRAIRVTRPKGLATTGLDYATEYAYDKLDRVIRQTVYGTSSTQKRITHACYDVAGDLRSVTSPRALRDTVTCPATGVPNTATYDYDDAHRVKVAKDALGHATRYDYDPNGNVTAVEKDIATGRVQRTGTAYDQRDMPVETRERLTATREVVTKTEYDKNGNRKRVVSPRGYDAAAGSGTYSAYLTAYDYDALNRLTRVTLPFGPQETERQYVHRSYDPNGNLAWTSLPTTTATASAVGAGAKTTMTHFDPGWIRTSDDPPSPLVRFDYTAQGWQASRTPDAPGPGGDGAMSWTYFDDGQLRTRSDQGGQPSTYEYDAHNLVEKAVDSAGLTGPTESAVETGSTWTGFDEPLKVRHRKGTSPTWTFTDYSYDENGNVKVRRENGEESTAGTQSKAPRRYELTYDAADWLTQQLDLGVDGACKDDQRIVNAFWPTGWEKQRDLYRASATCVADPTTWPKKQTTTWDHFDNGKLKTLVTKNGAGTVTESHTVGYETGGSYVNGNRVSDRYVLNRSSTRTGVTTCLATAPCDAVYEYDGRDRLTRHQVRAGRDIRYTLDQPANLLGDTTVRAGNVTTENRYGTVTTRKYTGNRLTSATVGTTTTSFWYDPLGNLDCVTLAAGSQANCSPSGTTGSSNLVTDYTYDYLSRLAAQRSFAAGAQTDKADYTYDALDRTVSEKEDHASTGKDRTTALTYQGLSSLVTREEQTGGTNAKVKTYSYDGYGHRLSMSDQVKGSATPAEQFSYSHDVHGSVSQLISDAGSVRASYGYDAYGGQEAPDSEAQSLTTGDPDNQTPLNPFRFSAKRMDSGTATSPAGTATLDMGARRFGPATGRFQQPDVYFGALSNLGLSVDPLTQNRYSLAGANPVSFMEIDGHMVLPDGSGGSAEAPSVIGAAAAPQPYQEPAPEPEPEPNVLQKAWNNTKDFVGGAKDGAVDAGQGLWQLGYDTFYGASPFADEQTQAETKARAHARGDLIKNPGKLIDAVKAPYQEDIAAGHDGRAAGRAVFDILSVIGTGGAGATAKAGTAARAAGGASRPGARFLANSAGDVLDTARVTIPEGKFGYLLKNPSKAGVFKDSMGFDQLGLDAALRSHLRTNFGNASPAVPMVGGGSKFSVRGSMTGPSGQSWDITTAWGVDPDGTVRLITATP